MGKENVATRFSCVHGLGGHTLVRNLNCGVHVSSTSFINLDHCLRHVIFHAVLFLKIYWAFCFD